MDQTFEAVVELDEYTEINYTADFSFDNVADFELGHFLFLFLFLSGFLAHDELAFLFV